MLDVHTDISNSRAPLLTMDKCCTFTHNLGRSCLPWLIYPEKRLASQHLWWVSSNILDRMPISDVNSWKIFQRAGDRKSKQRSTAASAYSNLNCENIGFNHEWEDSCHWRIWEREILYPSRVDFLRTQDTAERRWDWWNSSSLAIARCVLWICFAFSFLTPSQWYTCWIVFQQFCRGFPLSRRPQCLL